jgi:hypothetical protein
MFKMPRVTSDGLWPGNVEMYIGVKHMLFTALFYLAFWKMVLEMNTT